LLGCLYDQEAEAMQQAVQAPEAEKSEDRRKHTRHQWVKRVVVRLANGKMFEGTSFEISESGMSAVFPSAELRLGESVELSPILGYQLDAVLRHTNGKMYGFEFVGLGEEQVRKLSQQCKTLPFFRTMLDV
jgi:hypothetical protein